MSEELTLLERARKIKEPGFSRTYDIPEDAEDQYELAMALANHEIDIYQFADQAGVSVKSSPTYARCWIWNGIRRGHLKITKK